MSAVLSPPVLGGVGMAHVWASWRSLKPSELGGFTLMGLLYSLVDLSAMAYLEGESRWLLALSRQVLSPVLIALVLMLFWLPADRSDRQHPQRPWRLGLAALLGSVAAMLSVWLLVHWLDWPSAGELMRQRKGEALHSPMRWPAFIGDSLSVFIPSALTVALFELLERRQRAQASLQQLLHEQSVLSRQAVAARLAALQAQVEPQFLFDALVDIEQAYRRADPEAPAQIERLIRHLRVALPRLRELGGTLESEAELLESYLAVVAGRLKAPVRFSADWPDQLRGSPLPPMLLLPLLQRALRLARTPPSRCTLSAEPLADGGLRLRLAFDQSGLCGDDAELRGLAERLRSLFGGPAELQCRSSEDNTLFILELRT
jgi:Histidine kinase